MATNMLNLNFDSTAGTGSTSKISNIMIYEKMFAVHISLHIYICIYVYLFTQTYHSISNMYIDGVV